MERKQPVGRSEPHVYEKPAAGIREIAEWSMLAMTSGILGNATYDILKGRMRRRRKDARAPGLTRDDAIEIARIALAAYFRQAKVAGIDAALIPVSASAQPDKSGDWKIYFTSPGRSFDIEIPAGKIIDENVRILDSGDSKRHAKVSAKLTRRAQVALDHAASLSGDSKTDVVNRALTVYAVIMDEVVNRGATLTLKRSDGSVTELVLT